MLIFIIVFGIVIMYLAPKAYKIFANFLGAVFGKHTGKLIIRMFLFFVLIVVFFNYLGKFGILGVIILAIGFFMKKRK